MRLRGRAERGQATVEVALVLPVLAVLLLAIGQVIVVGVTEIQVINAARSGARAAAVGEPVAKAVQSGSSLDPARTTVTIGRQGAYVTVSVDYRGATDVPLVGAMVGDTEHSASITMRVETDS
ncbi:MAG: pilus assembly protein [Acidobacteria bacterium]|nr:pilus assembly protein [Acidobacteriota bacterium]